MKWLYSLKDAIAHLFYPQICAGCGNDVLPQNSYLCLQCIAQLPLTGFGDTNTNPIETIFSGRVEVQHAFSMYYFSKHSIIQQIMHEVKYRHHKELGIQLGTMMGHSLQNIGWIRKIDALVPVPVSDKKIIKRGYNQAELICTGIASVLNTPVNNHLLKKIIHTDTQTHYTREERWLNVKESFCLQNTTITNQHVLLVDDIITTGATLEACCHQLSAIPGCKISIATLCWAKDI